MFRTYLIRLVDQGEPLLRNDPHHIAIDFDTPAGVAAAGAQIEAQAAGMARRANLGPWDLDRCWVEVIDPDTGRKVHTHYLTAAPRR